MIEINQSVCCPEARAGILCVLKVGWVAAMDLMTLIKSCSASWLRCYFQVSLVVWSSHSWDSVVLQSDLIEISLYFRFNVREESRLMIENSDQPASSCATNHLPSARILSPGASSSSKWSAIHADKFKDKWANLRQTGSAREEVVWIISLF